jgi:hypothetical protein
MAAGLALMFVAPLLINVTPSRVFWTDADQVRYQKASADFHAASYEVRDMDPRRTFHGQGGTPVDPVAAKAQYEAARAEFEAQKARLESAQSGPAWMKWLCRVAGMALAAAGAYYHLRSRTRPPKLRPATDKVGQVR